MTKSIQFKIIVSVVLFTLIIVGLERYQLSQSITEQFISSKKSKNELLIHTMSPIIALNLSLGLDSANKEYIEQIIKQNSDLEFVRLIDMDKRTIYEYKQEKSEEAQKDDQEYNHCFEKIDDDLTHTSLATIELRFSNIEFEEMKKNNQRILINVTIVTIVLLIIFIFFLKLEFKNLKELTEHVLLYDPKLNNFPLKSSKKKDEVSHIRNAIISMVQKISSYTELLDNTNALLEEKVKQRTLELEQSNRELKLLASVDPLTNLYNRRYFTNTSEQILEIAKRNKAELSLIMLDIDHFKNINDTYGHQSGDEVISFIASVLIELTRKSDIACRFGGEEFIVLFPHTSLDGAYAIAEKIRMKIEKTAIQTQAKESLLITVSIGVSTFSSESDMESLIHKADKAMYEAKERGRNLTCKSK